MPRGMPPAAALEKLLAEARKKKPDATLADVKKPFGASYRAMLEEVKSRSFKTDLYWDLEAEAV